MKIWVDKHQPLRVRDQIVQQIRVLIEGGELEAGQALPSAKDMAGMLNVNRNTVAAAYKDLASKGLVRVVVGSGTYVEEGQRVEQSHELEQMVNEFLTRAGELGFSTEQIAGCLHSHVTRLSARARQKHVLVVECNEEAMRDIAGVLEKELGVSTEGVLIQQLETDRALVAQRLADKDLVVCGFNHVEEFRRVVPGPGVELVAVMLKPQVRILNELLKLPAGARVGFTCANPRSTEAFYKDVVFSSGSRLTTVMAGANDSAGLQRMLDECEVVFATHYVYDRVAALAGPDTRVVKVDLTIDAANVELVREVLSRPGGGA